MGDAKQMELWDIYDKDRSRANKTVERGKELGENEFHLIVHICIFNSSGNMLIQQRQPFKKGWPNLWDFTVGGCALTGETSAMAAQRELFEEIGVWADLSGERPFVTVNSEKGFDDYYLLEKEIDINTLALQREEVQRVKWASKQEILESIDRGDFIPYHHGWIAALFDMRGHRGAFRAV